MTEDELKLALAEFIGKTKPYLIEIEEEIQRNPYASIDLRLEVRGGRVERVTTFTARTWIHQKEKPIDTKSET